MAIFRRQRLSKRQSRLGWVPNCSCRVAVNASAGRCYKRLTVSRGKVLLLRVGCLLRLARHSLRIVRSSWRRRAGSATKSTLTIFPRVIVNLNTTRGRPPGAHTSPAAPFTSAGCAARARPEKVSATARAPRTSLGAPACTAARSARSTTSGSSSARSASKSPQREAARKASTTSRWRAGSA
jgi:hypothetical protein